MKFFRQLDKQEPNAVRAAAFRNRCHLPRLLRQVVLSSRQQHQLPALQKSHALIATLASRHPPIQAVDGDRPDAIESAQSKSDIMLWRFMNRPHTVTAALAFKRAYVLPRITSATRFTADITLRG